MNDKEMFFSKISKLETALLEKGIPITNVVPGIFRSLWKMGFLMKPPIFESFFKNWIKLGVVASFLWLLVSLWHILDGRAEYLSEIAGTIIFGSFFGLVMSLFYEKRKKKLGLGDWEEL